MANLFEQMFSPGAMAADGLTPQAEPNFLAALQQPLDIPMSPVPGNLGGPMPDLTRGHTSGKRRSILDIIGGISDVVADVGGAKPLYQAGLDADRARGREEVNQDWLQKFNTQRFDKGVQDLASGEEELRGVQTAKLGQAVRGLDTVFQRGGVSAALKAWPIVASQLNIKPEEQAKFAEQLAADPENTIKALNSALNPTTQGSLPKEVQIYNLLKGTDPEAAQEYLDSVSSGDKGITEYQAAQLDLGDRRLTESQRAALARERVAARRLRVQADKAEKTGKPGAGETQVAAAQSARGVITEMRDAYNRLKNAGAINAKGQGAGERGAAWAYENLPLAERMANPDAFSARQDLDRLRTAGISSLLPLLGGLSIGGKNIDAAKELDTWRKAIASASDYESAMRALDGFQRRVDEITAGSPGATSRPARRAGPARRPAAKPAGGSKPSVSNW